MESASQMPLSAWFFQDDEGQDIYDCYLTQAEIQGSINHVNGKREANPWANPCFNGRSKSRQCVLCFIMIKV